MSESSVAELEQPKIEPTGMARRLGRPPNQPPTATATQPPKPPERKHRYTTPEELEQYNAMLNKRFVRKIGQSPDFFYSPETIYPTAYADEQVDERVFCCKFIVAKYHSKETVKKKVSESTDITGKIVEKILTVPKKVDRHNINGELKQWGGGGVELNDSDTDFAIECWKFCDDFKPA